MATQVQQQVSAFNGRAFLQTLVLVVGTAVALVGSALIGMTNAGIWVILGVIASFTGIVMVLRPAFGVFVLVAFVYLNLSDIIEVQFGIPSLNKLLIALIFVGVIGTRSVIRRRPITFRSTEAILLLYGIIILLSGLGSNNPAAAFDNIIDYAKDFAIIIILVQVCDDERVWKSIQWIIMSSAALLALLTCYQMLTGDTSNTFFGLANAPVHQITEGYDNTRPTGPLVDPNFYAQMLLMVLPMAAYRFLDDRRNFNRIVGLAFTGLIALAIIFTYSRSAFIMMTVVGLLIVLERRINIFKLAVVGVLIVTAALPILPPGFLDRIATLGGVDQSTGAQEASFTGRTSEMIVAGQMFMDHPVLGIGYASYDKNYITYSIRLGMDNRLQEREAHSLYLEIAAETGIAGIIVWAILIIAMFRMFRDARIHLAAIQRHDLISWVNGLQFGLIGYLLTSIFLHDGYIRYLRLSIALAVSASVIVDALVAQQQEKRKRGLI
jgi:O-antigen ligase